MPPEPTLASTAPTAKVDEQDVATITSKLYGLFY